MADNGVSLRRDQIFAKKDLPTEKVDIPEWGGCVYVRSFTAEERDQFEQEMIDTRTGKAKDRIKNIRARFCLAITVDEKGNRLFADDDIQNLGNKSAAAVDRIFSVGQRLNKMSDADVEELAGN